MSTANRLYECPMCKTAVSYSYTATNITICSFCKSVLDRNEGDVLLARAYKKIHNATGIIQIGTTGIAAGKKFTVTGRFRAWFPDSVYNYWTIIFEDDSVAHLSEGYGLYDIYIQKPLTELLTPGIVNSLTTGKTNQFNDSSFVLLNKDTCTRFDIEGELKMPVSGDQFAVLEFGTAADKRVTVIEFLKNYWVGFEVINLSPSSLQLQNTAAVNSRETAFTCINCNREFIIKAYPYTKSYSCAHCGAGYVLNDKGEYEHKYTDELSGNKGHLSIGSKGIIKGIMYEVIGYALKQELNQYAARWSEYTLYNQLEGFAFVSEYNGHWMYIRERSYHPVFANTHTTKFTFDGEDFLLYNAYNYKAIDTFGEFPYDVFDVTGTKVKEYISPPEMWIEERNKDNVDWFLGEHIGAITLETAFKTELPSKIGIGAIEPKGYVNPYLLIKVSFIAILLFLAAHLLMGYTKENRVLLNNEYFFNDSLTVVDLVSEKLTFDKWKSNVAFEIIAPVDNSWLSFSATLVNTKDGTEYSFEKGVEYYHGYDSDGSWSEGSTNEKAYLSSVPEGSYILRMHAERKNTAGARSFSVKATYDTDIHSNLFIMLGFLIVFPVVWILIIRNNEANRWMNSDYSPYKYST